MRRELCAASEKKCVRENASCHREGGAECVRLCIGIGTTRLIALSRSQRPRVALRAFRVWRLRGGRRKVELRVLANRCVSVLWQPCGSDLHREEKSERWP
jgi:hypothetical protein